MDASHFKDGIPKARQTVISFLHFGVGPRNYIGMHFAMVEMKMAVCSMVRKFRLFPIEETLVRSQFVFVLNCYFKWTVLFMYYVQSVRINYVFKTDFS